MLDTNRLIKDVAYDIIGLITIFGLLNNSCMTIRVNNKTYPIYTNFIGVGISMFIIRKYI